jgi:hypothetical protein
MYLDDCIVLTRGDDQFLERLDKILIKTHNIFLKPTKCILWKGNILRWP